MISSIPLGLIGGTGPAGSGPSGEEGRLTPVPGEDGTERFEFDAHVVTAKDIEVLKDRCGLFDPDLDRVTLVEGQGTGLVPPTEEEYDLLLGTANFYDGVTLSPSDQMPLKIDHSTEGYFPPVNSQGAMGSCGSWAAVYYAATYAQAKDEGWTDCSLGTNQSRLLSPNWAYNKVNHGYDGGSHTWTNAMLLATLGCSDWKNMPYTDTDCLDWGGEAAWRVAPRYRLQNKYDYTYGDSTMVLKSWLVQGFVLPLALDANEYSGNLGTGDNVISSTEYSTATYNHANTIVGYDDTITADGDAGAFKIVNSWGKTWGSAWGGNGYYYMTYDAVAELSYPIIRIYDRVDYEPTLLATIDQSAMGSRDSRVMVGTDSGLYSNREPAWDCGDVNFPAFMAVDVSEMEEDLGLTDFWLYIGSGNNASTVSEFELEWYKNGYSPASPTRTFTSPDTPKTAPGYMDISFEDVHINLTAPLDNAVINKVVTLEGNCTERIGRVILQEDFEGPWNRSWVNTDVSSSSGHDTWGNATYRVNAGNRSVWCAGSDHGVAFFEDFNHGGSTPSGWTMYSAGSDTYPWTMVNSGYYGCGGSDYAAVADSDQGAGTNITEWLYMTTPFNASAFTGLELRFYAEYDYYDGEEYGEALYATGSTYPTFTSIANYTSDTYGYKQYDISSLDGEEEIYIAFRYHGTDDWHMVVDDVLVVGDKDSYDHNMSANLYTSASCAGYDNVTLEYYFWLESENNKDGLYSMYWSSTDSKWFSLKWHTGSIKKWTKVSVEVPTNATYIGFLFSSDGSTNYEGAYLDDVTLTGYVDLDAVDLSVNGGSWTEIDTSAKWSYDWATGALGDASYTLRLRADYNGDYSYDSVTVTTDNTAPSIAGIWNDAPTTSEVTNIRINVTDASGIGAVSLLYSINGQTGVNISLSGPTGPMWDLDLAIPADATSLKFSFWVEDSLGNGKRSTETNVGVTDNDAPQLQTDTTSSSATTGDAHTFAITATDNVAVDSIYLRYWYQGDATDTNVSSTGGTFEHTITVLHTLRPIYYELGVFDSAGLMDKTTGTVTVSDNDLPDLGTDGSSASATTGETATLSITATDNIGMSEMRAMYRFGTGSTTTVTMTKVGIDTWSLTVGIPSNSLDKLFYQFSAGDAAGNWNTSTEVAIDVIDNDDPTFGADSTLTTATTGDPFTFSIEVNDNVAVQGAWVLYRYGSGTTRNGTLTSSNGILWQLIVTIDDTLQDLTYSFGTEDTSGNLNTDPGGSVSISDNDAPIIVRNLTPITTTTGEFFKLKVEVSDNTGVGSVLCVWGYSIWRMWDAVLPTSVDPGGNGTYEADLYTRHYFANISYCIVIEDDHRNTFNSSWIYINVTDNDLPVFEKDMSDANGTTGDPCRFAINVSDNVDFSKETVFLNYAFDRGPYTNVSMTWETTPNPYWGIAEHYVDMPMYTLSRVAYFFTVKDAYSNWNNSASYSFVMLDNDRPLLGTDTSDGFGTTGDIFTWEIEVEDNIECSAVHVVYWLGVGPTTNDTMVGVNVNAVGNGTYQHVSFVVPPNTMATSLSYYFVGSDEAGNWNKTTVFIVSVFDNDPPTIISDDSDAAGTTGDLFHAEVTVSDNRGVMSVHLNYSIGNIPTPRFNDTMTGIDLSGIGNGSYSFDIMTPSDTVGPINYRFDILDISGIWTRTGEVTTPVLDNDKPSFGEDSMPDTADTDLSYFFSIQVWDNIEVAEVWVEYWYGHGRSTNMSLTSTTNSTWESWIVVEATLEDLRFFMGCVDTSGNLNHTPDRTVDVIDINGPQMINRGTKSWATTGDPFEFTITAGDNVGLKLAATLWYVFGEGELAPYEMEVVEAYPSSRNVLFSLFIDVPSDQTENITYSYELEDLYGNVLLTHPDIIRVRDNDDPVIVEDRTPVEVGMGENLTFLVVVSDNIGIGTVEVEYAFGEGDPETAEMAPEGTLGVHTFTIGIAVDELGPISYQFRVEDLKWNDVKGIQQQVLVVDGIPPEILNTTWGEPVKGTDVTVVLQAMDNMGVEQASLRYRIGEGTETTVEMDENMEAVIPIPRNADGDLRLVFAVLDAAGNEALSEEILVPLLNAAPTVDPVPVWEIDEERDSTLDLAPFISDANDGLSSLTLSCEDGTVTVDGLELSALYTVPFPDRTIDLTVSDGEDETDFQVTIHIVAVNDAPVITSISPKANYTFKEGKVVTFTVTTVDEEGDDIAVTWILDGVTIGTGDTLDYKKLKSGTRTIKVTVSDGEASVDYEFPIVVQKEEESPTLGGAFVLLAMLVGMAATMMKRKGESDCPD